MTLNACFYLARHATRPLWGVFFGEDEHSKELSPKVFFHLLSFREVDWPFKRNKEDGSVQRATMPLGVFFVLFFLS